LSTTTISNVFACTDCNGLPLNSVRYDTPTFAGFSASASWGEDDFWDVALRYAGEFSGFKLAAAAAYAESTDDDILLGDGGQHFQVGAYVQHVPTGLFVYGAFSDFENDDADFESDNWYVKAGIRQRWTPLGHTVLYGEYQDGEQEDTSVTVGDVQLWGLGAV